MNHIFTRVALAALTISLSSLAQGDADELLSELLDQHWEASEKERVFFRRDPDSFRMNGALPEFSAQAIDRRHQFNEATIKRLDNMRVSEMSPASQVSYKIFRYERLAERARYSQPDKLFPFTNRSSWQSYFANAPDNMSFLTERDYENYLVSLADYPRYNAEKIQLLEQALDNGYTHYCVSMDGFADAIAADVVVDPVESALYKPFLEMPASVDSLRAGQLQERGLTLIDEKVLPAFREFHQYYLQRYEPACRKVAGVGSLPGGEEYYAFLVGFYTTTAMTPREIHELGLSEVERIRAEMDSVIEAVGFQGGFKEFVNFLRSDARFYTDDPQDLLEKVALISKRMDGQLPRLFATLPRNTYDVKPVPAALAERTSGAYYVPAPGDGRTPGTYFINTSKLDSRPLYVMEALSLHEAVPGHHLQNAIAQEGDIPQFRRFLNHSAYTEGWGLYAERLGLEAGFYTDPYSNFGRLTYEMWRACRLVVDTGIHVFGWTRQQGIDYLLKNTALSAHEATSEIDRYITWPAQALSYKIGELKIRELRTRAEQDLGEDFDLRAFHDVVLANGSVPIAVLEELVVQWIASGGDQ
jgi:uncharacterized protein (DUF885 family)